jgi:hypothetical protein
MITPSNPPVAIGVNPGLLLLLLLLLWTDAMSAAVAAAIAAARCSGKWLVLDTLRFRRHDPVRPAPKAARTLNCKGGKYAA